VGFLDYAAALQWVLYRGLVPVTRDWI